MREVKNFSVGATLPAVLREVLPSKLLSALQSMRIPPIEELRLHKDRFVSVSFGNENFLTDVILSGEEMEEILKAMCRGSLYAFRDAINDGYLPLEGGVRVGVCGRAAVENGKIIGVDRITGLVIRIPHAVSADASEILSLLRSMESSEGILIYAPPGGGKTTLLRSLAVLASSPPFALRTVAVDTREELEFSFGTSSNLLDFLKGYPRAKGMEIAVRSLGAKLIICDEIGGIEDARSILLAANSGVPIVVSIHASTLAGLFARPGILALHDARVFGAYVGLSRPDGRNFSFQITKWEEADDVLQTLRDPADPIRRRRDSVDTLPL